MLLILVSLNHIQHDHFERCFILSTKFMLSSSRALAVISAIGMPQSTSPPGIADMFTTRARVSVAIRPPNTRRFCMSVAMGLTVSQQVVKILTVNL